MYSIILAVFLSVCFVPTQYCVLATTSGSSSGGHHNLNVSHLLEETTDLFWHGYNSYMKYAFPKDELCPLTCTGRNTLGPYALTLVDALDVLYLVDRNEFEKQVSWVVDHITFDMDAKVSVFETNIRIVGAMISAYYLTNNTQNKIKLIALAEDLVGRLLPAFDTPTGICYNELYLKKGVVDAEGQTTCPAAAGTLLLEFGMLSHITGNCSYLAFAKRTLDAVWRFRSATNLLGTIINVVTGNWAHVESNIGASIDSFYEYLVKTYVLFGDPDIFERWRTAYKAAVKYMSYNSWYLTVRYDNAELVASEPNINSLQAFWPAMEVLAGDVNAAVNTFQNLYCVHEHFGFLPEVCRLDNFFLRTSQGHEALGYPLRPEIIESAYFLYQATKDPIYVDFGRKALRRLQRHAKVECGIAAIKDVQTGRLEDKMDSFILSETLKYLYLLFREAKGLSDNPWGFKSGVLYTTEAHPLPLLSTLASTYKKCQPDESKDTMFGVSLKADRSYIRRASNLENTFAYESFPKRWFEEKRVCPRIPPWLTLAIHTHSCTTTEDGIQRNRHRRANRKKETGENTNAPGGGPTVEENSLISFTLPANSRRTQSRPLQVRIPKTVKGEAVRAKDITGGVRLYNFPSNYIYDPSLQHICVVWDEADPFDTRTYFVNNASFGPPLRIYNDYQFEVVFDPLTNGCQPYSLDNHGKYSGKALAAARGGCTFQRKVLNAQEAGAAVAIIVNHENAERVFMGPDDELKGFDIRIPSVLIGYRAWTELLAMPNQGGIRFAIKSVETAAEQFAVLGYRVQDAKDAKSTMIVLEQYAHTLEVENEPLVWDKPVDEIFLLPHEMEDVGGTIMVIRAQATVLTASSLPTPYPALSKVGRGGPSDFRRLRQAILSDGSSSYEITWITRCGVFSSTNGACFTTDLYHFFDPTNFLTEEATILARFTLITSQGNGYGGIGDVMLVMRYESAPEINDARIRNAGVMLVRAMEAAAGESGCREVTFAKISPADLTTSKRVWYLITAWQDGPSAERFYQEQNRLLDPQGVGFQLWRFLSYFPSMQESGMSGVDIHKPSKFDVLKIIHK